jgi:hypothetical protein
MAMDTVPIVWMEDPVGSKISEGSGGDRCTVAKATWYVVVATVTTTATRSQVAQLHHYHTQHKLHSSTAQNKKRRTAQREAAQGKKKQYMLGRPRYSTTAQHR